MRRLYHKILIIFLPFILFYGFPTVCLYRAGELFSFDTYLHPLEKGRLFGLAYSYYDKEYKYYMTNDYMRPQVLVLGSSRIMQVKSNIVRPGVSFYNAGGAVQNVYEFRLFLEKLAYKPELIIANFDQFYFNPYYEDQKGLFSRDVYEKPAFSFTKYLNSCATFYEDLFADKINLRELFRSDQIGVTAICTQRGFTTDGTYYDGMVETHPEVSIDYNFKGTMERIRNKNLRFQGCDHADKSILGEVDSLLTFCDQHDIMFVGFLPPFAPKISDVLEKDGHYGYLNEIPELLNEVASRHQAVMMDFTRYENQYASDCFFLDGFHGSDLVYHAMMADMIDSVPQIQKYFIPSDSIRMQNNRQLRQHTKYHEFRYAF